MPALDRFIALIFERQATSLTLRTDRPIQLELNGTPRPVTKENLTSPKLLALVREIIPEAMRHLLEGGDGHVAFDYTTDDKHVDVSVDRAEGVVTARVTPFRPHRSTAGRVAAREILLSIPAVANLIREGKTFQLPSIIQTNKKLGMIQLNDSLIEYVEKKVITPEEAYLKSVDKQGIEMALKSRNIKLSLQDTA